LTASHATGAWIGETAWGLASGNPGNQGGSPDARVHIPLLAHYAP
jgi:hypothetical protein